MVSNVSTEKQQLLDAFQGFSSNAVDENQIKLAMACIHTQGNHYQLIPFQDIIELNKVGGDLDTQYSQDNTRERGLIELLFISIISPQLCGHLCPQATF